MSASAAPGIESSGKNDPSRDRGGGDDGSLCHGVRAEREARQNLEAGYERFMAEQEPAKKDEAGKDLIRAIFGKDALAKDTIL